MKHDARAEEGVLYQLKTRGPQTAAQVARRLNVTAMAVRQHLYRLQADGPGRIQRRTAQGRAAGAGVEVDRRRGRALSRYSRRPDGRDHWRGARGLRRGGDGQAAARAHAPSARRISRAASSRAGLRSQNARRRWPRFDASKVTWPNAPRMPDGSIAVGGKSLSDLRGGHRPARVYAAKSSRCSARCLATRRGSSEPITYCRARGAAPIESRRRTSSERIASRRFGAERDLQVVARERVDVDHPAEDLFVKRVRQPLRNQPRFEIVPVKPNRVSAR